MRGDFVKLVENTINKTSIVEGVGKGGVDIGRLIKSIKFAPGGTEESLFPAPILPKGVEVIDAELNVDRSQDPNAVVEEYQAVFDMIKNAIKNHIKQIENSNEESKENPIESFVNRYAKRVGLDPQDVKDHLLTILVDEIYSFVTGKVKFNLNMPAEKQDEIRSDLENKVSGMQLYKREEGGVTAFKMFTKESKFQEFRNEKQLREEGFSPASTDEYVDYMINLRFGQAS